MKAHFQFTIKFDVFQDVENVENLLDMKTLAEEAAFSFADMVTESGAVASYEIMDNRMEASV